MTERRFGALNLFAILLILVWSPLPLLAQWEESLNGNEWINYSKKYLRIEVTSPGIQRIKISDLPKEYQSIVSSTFQLWHRGKEVPLIKADAQEILFYGVINDGSSDSLVFRPKTARKHPYVNLYADRGVYFLTTDSKPKKLPTVDGSKLSGIVEPFHIQKDVKTYKEAFGESTRFSSFLNNSFYEAGNVWMSKRLAGLISYRSIAPDTIYRSDLQLQRWAKSEIRKPSLELYLVGSSAYAHNIFAMVSPDKSKYRTVSNHPFSGFEHRRDTYDLENSDFSSSGAGTLKLASVPASPADTIDWFNIAYYVIDYPQRTELPGSGYQLFSFPYRDTFSRRIEVSGTKPASLAFDVTNPDAPIQISPVQKSGSIEFQVTAIDKKALKIFVANPEGYQNIPKTLISEVNLGPVYTFDEQSKPAIGPINKAKYDYFIVTSSPLIEGATAYAEYRSSSSGGSHKTLVMNIRDIYDLFNYGEPSPIAIRNFMKYVLENKSAERKGLFLIGRNTSYPLRVVPELVNEVPTFGDPGSDNLLIAGLAGNHADVAAMPVGRLPAFNNEQILGYLEKVKSYEHERFDISWRKNALHMSGGQNVSEIQTLKGILTRIDPILSNSSYAGTVSHIVKTISSPTVQRVNISSQINNGIGLVTFFGHGSYLVTDLDIGYVSDVSRGYANKNKYPVMYFNGCGVGNIFLSNSTAILSDDWLLTPNKGAIAIIANSYDSYISSSAKHIQTFYETLFNEESNSASIGETLLAVSRKIANGSGYNAYDAAGLHQICLQGDPLLKLLKAEEPDYIVSEERQSIFVSATEKDKSIGQSQKVRAGVAVVNGGMYRNGEKIEVKVTFEYKNGKRELETVTLNDLRNADTLWFDMENVKDLERLEVILDPQKKLTEFSKSNNASDLVFDWEKAKDVRLYPSDPIGDLISPRFKVLFTSREIPNESSIPVGTQIDFTINDDRILDPSTVTLDAYIRNCWDENCETKPILLDPTWLTGSSNRELVYTYKGSPLAPGEYQILFSGTDKSGNRPIDGGYTVFFRVVAEENTLRVIASPNPVSGNFVKFSVEKYPAGTQSITFHIFNALGQAVYEHRMSDFDNNLPKSWYWNVKNADSGLYTYKVVAEPAITTGAIRVTGKLVVNK
ncbi:hypothetical protein GCM10023091_19810 [Ravibacter arvi]|uniref:Gingipain domain-containing protein n=1 Tax=Ravibacter arvi TaxID=2051041 RepID=A0ABP8LWI8_9BACT